tara:strand:- start:5731 stop:6594 length:864 start_codon:yes stop_codon:yes gene_type:complete
MNLFRVFFSSLYFLLALPVFSSDIERVIFSDWEKPPINIFYKLPKEINNKTEILFIIHGNSRNADGYIEVWASLTNNKNVILIAPEFIKSTFPNYNTLQMSSSSGKIKSDTNLYLNASIDLLFNFYRNKFNVKTDQYMIYGHSGGAQFVHRYLLMSDMPKIKKAVAANAGWYTFLGGWKFPYGIKEPPSKLSSDNLRRFLKMKLSILIGSKDTKITSSVNQSEGANKQGINRFQRANNFFISSSDVAKKHDLEFNWNYKIIKGVGHSNSKMSLAAAEVLLADSTYEE